MFVPAALSRATNDYARSQDKAIPSFRRTAPGLVELNGAILRYSTTTGDAPHDGTEA
jgi:hypothetical protein